MISTWLIGLKIKLIIYKRCPFWYMHRRALWNFQKIQTYKFCKYCPLMEFKDTGRAYRRAIGRED